VGDWNQFPSPRKLLSWFLFLESAKFKAQLLYETMAGLFIF